MSPRLLVPLLLLFAVAGGFALYFVGGGETRGATERPERAAVEPEGATAAADLAPAAEAELGAPTGVGGEGRKVVDAPIPVAEGAPEELESMGRATQKGTLVGRVVDALGAPIEGANVRAAGSTFELMIQEQMGDDGIAFGGGVRSGTTDADGRFELEDVPAGQPILRVRAGGFAPANFDDVTVAANERHELAEDLVLEMSAILEGIVLDHEGSPVADARVDARPKQEGMFGFVISSQGGIRTAKDGTFKLDQLPREELTLIVTHDDHARHSEALDAREARMLPAVEIRLPRGMEITGRLSGVPADEASRLVVVAQPRNMDFTQGFQLRHAKPAADGSFRLRGLKENTAWTLQAIRGPEDENDTNPGSLWPSPDNRVTEERVANAGERDVQIPWLGAVAIVATVVDASTGAPIETLQVESGFGWFSRFRRDDGEVVEHFPGGEVRLDGLRPDADGDDFQLKIDALGYEAWERHDLTLEAGRDLDLGTIELAPLPQVRVTVLDARTGRPVQGADVSLRPAPEKAAGGSNTFSVRSARISVSADDDDVVESIEVPGGSTARKAETDEDGVAVLDSFEGRTCELTVRASDFAPVEVTGWELPEGTVAVRTVELREGGSVAVTALDQEGAPLAGRRIEHREPSAEPEEVDFFLPGHGGDGKSRVTDGAGQVVFANLAPGEHRFRLKKASNAGGLGGGMVFFTDGMGGGDDEGWTSVVVAEGERSETTLVEEPTATLVGRVTERGEPLSKARLYLRERAPEGSGDARVMSAMASMEGALIMGGGGGSNATRTDRKGNFEFEGLEAGEYTLVIRHPDRAMPYEEDVTLGVGEQRRDFDLPVAILAGRVVDPDGRGVAGVAVSAEEAVPADGPRTAFAANIVIAGSGGGVFGGGIGGQGTVKTNAEGYFELRGVRSDVALRVVANGAQVGWQEGRSDEVRVAPDERRDRVDVAVEPAGTLQVTVKAAGGGALEFARLELTPLDAGEDAETRNEFLMGGLGKVQGLAPGTWNLVATGGGFDDMNGDEERSATQVVEVVAGGTTPVDLTLPQ